MAGAPRRCGLCAGASCTHVEDGTWPRAAAARLQMIANKHTTRRGLGKGVCINTLLGKVRTSAGVYHKRVWGTGRKPLPVRDSGSPDVSRVFTAGDAVERLVGRTSG